MSNFFKKIDGKKTGIFAAGVLFGTAGIKLLTSRDAKKVYSHGTAAVLRAKDCVMKTVTNVQENASDIYAEAKQINADREIEAEAQVVEDEAETEEQAEENEICDYINKVQEETGFSFSCCTEEHVVPGSRYPSVLS